MYTIDYRIYNAFEENDVDESTRSFDEEEQCFEYEVFLINDGRVVDSFDSAENSSEQHLFYRTCEAAVQEIKEDVANGKIKQWFNIDIG